MRRGGRGGARAGEAYWAVHWATLTLNLALARARALARLISMSSLLAIAWSDSICATAAKAQHEPQEPCEGQD